MVAWCDDDDVANADDGTFKYATTTIGSTIGPYSTAGSFYPATDMEWVSLAQIADNTIVQCYNDETDSDTGKCMIRTCTSPTSNGLVMTCSGTPSGGTPVAMDGRSGVTDYYPYMTDTVKIASDRFVSCWQYEDLTGDPGWCSMATWSGTTPTFTATSSFTSTAPEYTSVGSGGSDGDFWITWQESAGDSGFIMYATSTSNQIYYNTPVVFNVGGIENTRAAAYSDNVALVAAGDTTSGGVLYAFWADTDSGYVYNATSSLPVIFDSGPLIGGVADMGIVIEFISENKFVICYQDDTNGDDLYCVVGTIDPPEEPAEAGNGDDYIIIF
jgi:hypothetical protein